MIQNKYYDNKMMLIILIMPVTLFSKWFQFTVLPGKYFWDSQRMLSMLTGSGTMDAWGGSYEVAVSFFDKINIFNFSTLEEFAYALAFIFSLALIFIFIRIQNLTLIQTLYYLATIGLLNIYVFNISKDIIQFLIFFLMYLVIIAPRINSSIKLILILGLFYWESTFFRSYYIIMGALFLVAYLLLKYIQIKNIKMNSKIVINFLVIMFIMFTCFLLIVQVIMPEEYEAVIGVRDSNLNEVAVSQIENWIESDGTLHLFLVNYLINSIRMMIPVELLTKGISYLPFIVFQIMTLYYLFQTVKSLNSSTKAEVILSLAIFIGYLMGSFIFEPDFGSFIRHESATFPILHLLITRSYTKVIT